MRKITLLFSQGYLYYLIFKLYSQYYKFLSFAWVKLLDILPILILFLYEILIHIFLGLNYISLLFQLFIISFILFPFVEVLKILMTSTSSQGTVLWCWFWWINLLCACFSYLLLLFYTLFLFLFAVIFFIIWFLFNSISSFITRLESLIQFILVLLFLVNYFSRWIILLLLNVLVYL